MATATEAPKVRASAKYLRQAPRKTRVVADQIRGLPLPKALALLSFSTRGAALDVKKLLESAAANAENNHDLDADELKIVAINVDEGPTLRRWRPRARGRATRIEKKTCHVNVVLSPMEQ